MKSIKQITITAILTAGILCAILYASCSKDACKGVTCLNYGTCSGSVCSCPSGAGGNNCQTIYRKVDSGYYVGISVKDTGTAQPDSAVMVFAPAGDTIFVNMLLSITDSANKFSLSNAPITLINNSSSGSTFTLAATFDTLNVTGTGNVNGTTASLNLTLRDQHDSLYRTISYNNFNKE